MWSSTEPWGIKVISVEVKDVLIPAALEDAMSMQAQAERERQARVILGDSERQVAEKFGEAAKTYVENPVALHLRAMNMLYEGLKENSTIVVVPSTAVETMELGNIAGITALSKELSRERKERVSAAGASADASSTAGAIPNGQFPRPPYQETRKDKLLAEEEVDTDGLH